MISCISLVLVALVGIVYAMEIEPNWLKTERVPVKLSGLPPKFSGYTIVQLSDLHLSKYNQRGRIHTAVDQAMKLKPDLIVLTGDFVSSLNGGEAEQLSQELGHLTAPDGVYAVLGNHDWWTDAQVVATTLETAGVDLLRNSHVALRREGETVYLAGVDDIWEGHDDLQTALDGIPAGEMVILLAHEPDFADEVSRDGRVALQLSGHTHGGIVRFPGLPAFVTPYLGHKYVDGLFTLGTMQLYVNRGVGVIRPPVRFGSRPELTLITLDIPSVLTTHISLYTSIQQFQR